MSIQAGINRVISLAGTISAIQENLKKDKVNNAATNKKTTISAEADRKVTARKEEIQRSRDFARMITEGVTNLSFNPNEYVPPERKEK